MTIPINGLAKPQPRADIASGQKHLEETPEAAERERLKQAAQDFEAIFLKIMLDSMRKTVPKSELFNGSTGEDIFRGMLDQEYATIMSEERLSGVAGAVEEQLARHLDKDDLGQSVQTIRKIEGQSIYSKTSDWLK